MLSENKKLQKEIQSIKTCIHIQQGYIPYRYVAALRKCSENLHTNLTTVFVTFGIEDNKQRNPSFVVA